MDIIEVLYSIIVSYQILYQDLLTTIVTLFSVPLILDRMISGVVKGSASCGYYKSLKFTRVGLCQLCFFVSLITDYHAWFSQFKSGGF